MTWGVSKWGASKWGVNGPAVTNVHPRPGTLDVPKPAPISFSIVDDDPTATIVLSSVTVSVRDAPIFIGSNFIEGWKASSVVPNTSNGYDLILCPPLNERWRGGESVNVRVVATDTVALSCDAAWSFGAAARPFRGRIYSMLVDGIRQADEELER
jgi:hypothetical protein